MLKSVMDKARVRDDGIKFKHASNGLPVPKMYADFAKMFDWCESQFGEFNQSWSTVYSNPGMNWHFKNREHLAHFIVTWF